jgi:3-hydroxy-D-aspartate aldolase
MIASVHLPPARVGASLDEVDTPALVLDLDTFERNLAALETVLAGSPVRVRPHAKPHKCPDIARRQIARGAVGVCCQKVSEAEAFADGGVEDILITNQIVGAPKLARLARLARRARIGVCVDDAGNVDEIDRAAAACDATIRVLVEMDVGGNRCGVPAGQPVFDLAAKVASSAHLQFGGLQAYHGRAQHVRDREERRAAARLAVETLAAALDGLRARGLPAEVVTGAGTGTVEFKAASGLYTEVQPGSYIFMDADYGRNLGADGAPDRTFTQSLHVLTTVMSRAHAGHVVVDAGLKAHSVDSGMPLVADFPGAAYTRASDEHGVIEMDSPDRPALGQKIRLIPGHCDPTVNLYDWLVCVRNGAVEDLWPITARGAIY